MGREGRTPDPLRHAGAWLARQACQLSDLPIGPVFRVSRHRGKCKSVVTFFQLATQMATRKDRHDGKAEYIRNRFTVLRQRKNRWVVAIAQPPTIDGKRRRLQRSFNEAGSVRVFQRNPAWYCGYRILAGCRPQTTGYRLVNAGLIVAILLQRRWSYLSWLPAMCGPAFEPLWRQSYLLMLLKRSYLTS